VNSLANSLDSASYFFDEIHRISSPGYIPTDNDILRAKSRTYGISHMEFSLDTLNVHLIDLGGARTERRKWIHHFDNMTSILFVVSLSDYDRIFHPDIDQNVLTETLTLFDSIVNSKWFQLSSIILFFNKIDLFRKKLPLSPLAKYFPDYCGGSDINEAVKYLLSKFSELNRGDRQIYAQYVPVVGGGTEN
jgi:guanine nucleotide-binding protein G(i) subunit alpha